MKKNNRIAIIDYGMGNLFSVGLACGHIGLDYVITSDCETIMNSAAAILPGVGAFGDAMGNLKKLDLITPIKEFISGGKPFMGVCLGMQLLMAESSEFGTHRGLNIFDGSVTRFAQEKGSAIKVPHVGWNSVRIPEGASRDSWSASPLEKTADGEYMYFVHSFFTVPENSDIILSTTKYEGVDFCSSIKWKNVFACQFHPEKSAQEGIKIYERWASPLLKGKKDNVEKTENKSPERKRT